MVSHRCFSLFSKLCRSSFSCYGLQVSMREDAVEARQREEAVSFAGFRVVLIASAAGAVGRDPLL